MDPLKIKGNWRSRGFSCDLWTDTPGTRWEDFTHATDELVLLLDGEVELEMKGKKILLRRGQEILIPAGTLHSMRNLGRTTSRWLYGYRSH